MTGRALLALGGVLAACGTSTEAAPATRAIVLAPVAELLCVTRGEATLGETVDEPTLRAFARGAGGDAAALELVYRGDTSTVRALATSGSRRQVGLKLRAENGCNLIYVMWRLDPRPRLEVSVKRNPGAKDHEACGAEGYIKVRPRRAERPPALSIGDRHTLRAAISGDELTAWIDDRVVWRGALPAAARGLAGPVGLRSDNLAFDLVGFHAPPGDPARPLPVCRKEGGDQRAHRPVRTHRR